MRVAIRGHVLSSMSYELYSVLSDTVLLKDIRVQRVESFDARL